MTCLCLVMYNKKRHCGSSSSVSGQIVPKYFELVRCHLKLYTAVKILVFKNCLFMLGKKKTYRLGYYYINYETCEKSFPSLPSTYTRPCGAALTMSSLLSRYLLWSKGDQNRADSLVYEGKTTTIHLEPLLPPLPVWHRNHLAIMIPIHIRKKQQCVTLIVSLK